MTSKHPLICIVAEISEWLKHLRMDLHLDWCPRDQNEEADALSNSDFTEFDEKNRVHVNLEKIRWFLLHDYLAAADQLYAEVKAFKMPPRDPPPYSVKPNKRTR